MSLSQKAARCADDTVLRPVQIERSGHERLMWEPDGPAFVLEEMSEGEWREVHRAEHLPGALGLEWVKGVQKDVALWFPRAAVRIDYWASEFAQTAKRYRR